MELAELNERIWQVDGELGRLFSQRMELCAALAREKKAQGLLLPNRDADQTARARFRAQAGEELQSYAGVMYAALTEIAHSYQDAVISGPGQTGAMIRQALQTTPQLFPEAPAVVCQGTEGAYSQQAAERLFREADISHVASFEEVFDAIAAGRCRYGVLPLENSTAGSVNRVYDLMMQHHFSIVRSCRLKIDHALLARPGAALGDIREIISHQQALSQCEGFLRSLPGVKVTAVSNTAMAARMVAESDRRDLGALSARSCAGLYGLTVLASGVQDMGNNHTRFICIGRELEIYPGADRTSVMVTTPHRPGALYSIMARINALGINLTKLESRPIPDRDFEFMFYFDLDAPVYSPRFLHLMDDMEHICETFRYLGSYSEVV